MHLNPFPQSVVVKKIKWRTIIRSHFCHCKRSNWTALSPLIIPLSLQPVTWIYSSVVCVHLLTFVTHRKNLMHRALSSLLFLELGEWMILKWEKGCVCVCVNKWQRPYVTCIAKICWPLMDLTYLKACLFEGSPFHPLPQSKVLNCVE